MKINGIRTYNNSAIQVEVKNKNLNNLKIKEEVSTKDSQNLSHAALIKYDFRLRLHSSMKDYDASFITNFASEYDVIKKEITIEYAGEDQKTRLAMLDEVFDESIKEVANRVAQSFEFFFDGSANLETRFRLGNKQSVFDHEIFKKHLMGMANAAKDLVNQTESTDQLKQRLLNMFQGGSLESMNYSDVTKLASSLVQISSPSMQGDSYRFGSRLAEWSENAKEILSANLSGNVLDQALHAVDKNTDTFKKVGAYIQIFSNNRSNLDERIEEMMKIHSELDKITEKLKELEKQMQEYKIPFSAMVTKLLEREGSLDEQSKRIAKTISGLQKDREELINDPASATESNEYKQIEKGFEDHTN